MYVYPNFGVIWTMNMGDMAKSSPFLKFFLSFLLFFSLNLGISKTVRGTGVKFFT